MQYIESRSLAADKCTEFFQKFPDISKARPKNTEKFFSVHFPIDVNEPVPETGHLNQDAGKFLVEGALLREDFEGIGIIFRRSKAVFRDYMVGQVKSALKSDNKRLLGAADFMRIRKKFLFRQAFELFEPLE